MASGWGAAPCWRWPNSGPAQLSKNPPGRYHPGAPRSQLKVSWHDEGRFTHTEGRRHDTAHAGQAEVALRPQPRPKLRRVRCLSRRLPPEQETTSQPPKRAKKHQHQTDRRSIAAEGRNHRSQTKNAKGDTKLASSHQASDQTKKTAAPRRRGGRGAPKRNAVVDARERDCKQQHT